jgi:hypothetical protein
MTIPVSTSLVDIHSVNGNDGDVVLSKTPGRREERIRTEPYRLSDTPFDGHARPAAV